MKPQSTSDTKPVTVILVSIELSHVLLVVNMQLLGLSRTAAV